MPTNKRSNERHRNLLSSARRGQTGEEGSKEGKNEDEKLPHCKEKEGEKTAKGEHISKRGNF